MRRSPLRSPPRMRGKVSTTLQGDIIEGITPAYAGKRSQDVAELQSGWDHPRVCGEKMCCTAIAFRSSGLPPRMRGKGDFVHQRSSLDGITPAYAGKSPVRSGCPHPRRDHPRVCGEKSRPLSRWVYALGLPPRMRGKVFVIFPVQTGKGIIPAYAGKSARRQAGPPGPATPPQMRLGWSPPPCTGRQCRTRKSTHARRARIPVPAHTPAPQ